MALEYYRGTNIENEEVCILVKKGTYITKHDFLEIARTMNWIISKDELSILILEEGDLNE